MKQKDLRHFFNYSFGNAAYALLSFISIPIITRIISKNEFGKYTMYLLGYFIILNICTMGMDQGLLRFCHDGSYGKRKVLFIKILKLIFLQFLFITLIIFLFRKKISLFLFEEYRFINIVLLLISVFLRVIFYLQNIMLRINGKSFRYALIQTINQAVFILASILFLIYIKKDFIFIIAGQIASFVISIVIGVFFDAEFWYAKNKISKKLPDMKAVFLYSIPYLPVVFSLWIMLSSDKFFIKHFYGLVETGIYSVANKIITVFNLLQASFSSYWLPAIYEHYRDKPDDRVYYKDFFEKAEVFLFCAMIIFIMFKDVVLLLFETDYRGAAYYIPFLLFIPVMQMLSQISGIGIDIEKKSYLNIISIFFALIFNIIGNYFFTRFFGPKGAGISTGISFIIYFILKTIIAKKIFSIQINFIKIFFSLSSVVLFSFLTTFYKTNFLTISSGIVFLFIILLIHKKNVFEVIEKFKKL